MQYMLQNGPYRARSQRTPLGFINRRFVDGYALALKVILIGCVAFGFFELVAYLLTLSDHLLVQIGALAAWSCGAIPLVYRLWRLDLGGTNHESTHPQLRLR